MARSHRPRPPDAPDLPPDLPAPVRDLPAGRRSPDVREQHLVGARLSDTVATGVHLIESRLEEVDLSGAVLRRAQVRDCGVVAGDWANANLTEATIRRVEMRGVRLTGAILGGASIEDSTFVECRIDLASFRFARLEAIRFEGCRIEEADLYGARLSSVVFSSSDLTRANLEDATFERCEMRGCGLDGILAPERLRGVGMPWQDIIRSAAVLASGLGVRVLADDED